MAKEYLVDTCIWRDFYEDRFSESGRHLGKYATGFFMRVLKEGGKILFSEAIIFELGKDYSLDDIYGMLNFLFLAKVLVKIPITPEETSEAKALAIQRNLPFIDCLIAIQARNYDVPVVSQDWHFIANLSDLVRTIKP